jgi:N-methylhydantoinase A
MNGRTFQIGCDIGGTFTDVVVVTSGGDVYTDKSDTTLGDLTQGVVAALTAASGQLGSGLDEVLANTTRFVNGTTVVTNSIAELKGAKVGLIATAGFGDTLRIARSPRTDARDHHLQVNVPDLVPRDCIAEVRERVDAAGSVIVALDADEAIKTIDGLVAKGVESIAISLLWSFANPQHEEALAGIIAKRHPDVYVSVSSRLYPMIREYERTVTTVLNSFTGLAVVRYTDRIEGLLREHGLRAPISFMQGFGGTISADDARQRPISLVDSGPAGGVVGARHLGDELGVSNVLTGDMGGTSFDVSVLPEGKYTVTQRVMLREFLTGLSKIDVLAVGAGGGSLGWIDARGVPQVGPHSAGAEPGPACYGRGGTDPTVTDAVVALGIIDPDAFLGGRRHLDREASRAALATTLAEPQSISIERAAADMFRLVTASMSHAVRRVTVEHGRDPRNFTFCSYGGALGVFAASICRQMGIRNVIIPDEAAVFSAYGLLATDDIRQLARSISWTGGDGTAVEATLRDLEAQALRGLEASGYARDDVDVQWQGDFKFEGQLFELTVPIPRDRDIDAALEHVRETFAEAFEAEFGAGTAWKESPVILLSARVVATGHTDKLRRRALVAEPAAFEPEPDDVREVVLPPEAEPTSVRVFDGSKLEPGATLAGPAIVEDRLTTILVPPGWELHVDGYGHRRLEDREPTTGLAVAEAARPALAQTT